MGAGGKTKLVMWGGAEHLVPYSLEEIKELFGNGSGHLNGSFLQYKKPHPNPTVKPTTVLLNLEQVTEAVAVDG